MLNFFLGVKMRIGLFVPMCVPVWVHVPGAALGSQLCQQLTKASLVFIMGGVEL